MSSFGLLKSRSIRIGGQRTSIRLEPNMWDALDEIARRECLTLGDVCGAARYRQADEGTLSAALRSLIVEYFRSAATDDGHRRAGHGDYGVEFAETLAKLKPAVKSVRPGRS